MVNLRLDVKGRSLAEGALVLGVPALLDAGPIGEASLPATAVGRGCIDLGGNLLGGVLKASPSRSRLGMDCPRCAGER
ncbi:hypothetical protein CDL15_Pgr015973 [Punica granatum]|nr:hypothetical protein CDL15_Pgr015973 [Punica granatum]